MGDMSIPQNQLPQTEVIASTTSIENPEAAEEASSPFVSTDSQSTSGVGPTLPSRYASSASFPSLQRASNAVVGNTVGDTIYRLAERWAATSGATTSTAQAANTNELTPPTTGGEFARNYIAIGNEFVASFGRMVASLPASDPNKVVYGDFLKVISKALLELSLVTQENSINDASAARSLGENQRAVTQQRAEKSDREMKERDALREKMKNEGGKMAWMDSITKPMGVGGAILTGLLIVITGPILITMGPIGWLALAVLVVCLVDQAMKLDDRVLTFEGGEFSSHKLTEKEKEEGIVKAGAMDTFMDAAQAASDIAALAICKFFTFGQEEPPEWLKSATFTLTKGLLILGASQSLLVNPMITLDMIEATDVVRESLNAAYKVAGKGEVGDNTLMIVQMTVMAVVMVAAIVGGMALTGGGAAMSAGRAAAQAARVASNAAKDLKGVQAALVTAKANVAVAKQAGSSAKEIVKLQERVQYLENAVTKLADKATKAADRLARIEKYSKVSQTREIDRGQRIVDVIAKDAKEVNRLAREASKEAAEAARLGKANATGLSEKADYLGKNATRLADKLETAEKDLQAIRTGAQETADFTMKTVKDIISQILRKPVAIKGHENVSTALNAIKAVLTDPMTYVNVSMIVLNEKKTSTNARLWKLQQQFNTLDAAMKEGIEEKEAVITLLKRAIQILMEALTTAGASLELTQGIQKDIYKNLSQVTTPG